jgi:hypothetical protein
MSEYSQNLSEVKSKSKRTETVSASSNYTQNSSIQSSDELNSQNNKSKIFSPN